MAARTTARKTTAAVPKLEPMENRFAGTCTECGQKVGKGEGMTYPPATKGGKWTVKHNEGECATESASVPEKTASVDTPPAPRKRGTSTVTKKRTETMPVKRTATPRKRVTPNVPSTTARKTVAKKTTPAKAVPAPVESASDDTPQELLDLLETIKTQINSGALDEILLGISDAIDERIVNAEKETTPAKKTTSAPRKSTTPATNRAEKMAPVKRAAASSGSASAPIKLRKGYEYEIHGFKAGTRNAVLNGQVVKFKTYNEDQTKAIVELQSEVGGKPVGTRLPLPRRALKKIGG